jgi:glyceraldehyde-3-phosphate dehydrogenase/erythrose-4-phosphate dehydrogenase
MKKIRAAIVGYGNIGHFVLDALQVAPDFGRFPVNPKNRKREKTTSDTPLLHRGR